MEKNYDQKTLTFNVFTAHDGYVLVNTSDTGEKSYGKSMYLPNTASTWNIDAITEVEYEELINET